MEYKELIHFLEHIGKDPSRLIFEDELTGIYNRRFLFNYFQSKVVWDNLEDRPLSLIMLDVDHFKGLNDTYGHQAGDQALVWVAGLLKEVAGSEGLAIRYAGDEFMILLPFGDNQAAVRLGEHLLYRVRQEPVRINGGDLHIAFSIGVASAPRDAQSGKGLIHRADTALYYAKKMGRNRLANARDIALEDVFAKTAIYQLEEVKLVGRRQQLARISEALKGFSQRQSQFLIVEGAPGMGKTEFLESVRRNLTRSKVWQVRVNGVPQELFRPYYLATNILVGILNQRQDKGAEVFDGLRPREVAYLAQVLPQLGVLVELPPEKDESARREGIFNTLVHFIPSVLDSQPLILFIDDMHYVDEATLVLLRRLMLRREIPIFICGTSSETERVEGEKQTAPLERFYTAYHEELGIEKITLTALTAEDIVKHIRGIFPNVNLPQKFEEELAQITQGSPLFLGEILHKLVLDQKISLSGQEWALEPLEEGYLPRSLEEIVSQKIAALDEESRQMLDHFSAWGEDVSLSALVGSSNQMEARVQEFVDRAVAQGLLSKDFQLNDEAIRFLSRRVLEIAYGSIGEDRKQELHGRIGNYQESLFNKKLIPSAATLAYHFKRSADQERARKYEQFLASWNRQIFNLQEATSYTGDWAAEFPLAEAPLDQEAFAHVPTVIRHILGALRNIKLYPPGSESINRSTRQTKEAIDRVLVNNDLLVIQQKEQTLLANDQRLEAGESRAIADAFLKFMSRFELGGIAFERDLSEQELGVFLGAFGHVQTKMIAPGFWKSFSAENDLSHIFLDQVRYTMAEGQAGAAMEGATLEQPDAESAARTPLQLLAGDQSLNQEELSQIPEIIRCLLRGARTIKLYPEQSKAISEAVQQLMEALQGLLASRPILALARVRNALLVNGVKVDTSDYEALANAFLKFLNATQISSLTFLRNIKVRELETFLGAFGKLSVAKLDGEFWGRLAEENHLAGILFNQHLYDILEEIREAAFSGDAEEGLPGETGMEEDAEASFEAYLEEMHDQLPDLLLKGDDWTAARAIARLFKAFEDREPSTRQRVIDVCRGTMESLTLAAQNQLARLLADPLLSTFSKEGEAGILVHMAFLLKSMANSFILFGDYAPASRLLFHIDRRYRQLDEAEEAYARPLAKALDIKLEPSIQKLIAEDLKSSDAARQRNAANLLGSLGQEVLPVLIKILKQEENFRAREITILLLKRLGPNAVDALKDALVRESRAEERLRILEVIDSLTHDLKEELNIALGDENPLVRKAAFQLAERLSDGYVVGLLLDYARNEETSLATAAIQSLGRLKVPSAVGEILSILGSTREEERIIACCRALGQIADRASVEPLAKIVTPKSRLSLRKKRSDRVRAAAAVALRQISHPRVSQVLAPLVNDRDPRIRQIAQNAVSASGSPPRS